MNAGMTRTLTVGALFIIIFGAGFWLSRSGKPYNGLLFTIHKLVGLGALVFLGITVSRIGRTQGLQPGQIAAISVAGLSFLVTIVTGGLVSASTTLPAFVTVIHRLFPYLTVLSTAGTLYLLMSVSREIVSAS